MTPYFINSRRISETSFPGFPLVEAEKDKCAKPISIEVSVNRLDIEVVPHSHKERKRGTEILEVGRIG